MNAPLTWINKTLEHYVDFSKGNKDEILKKVLLGLPFHGVMVDTNDKEPKGGLIDGKRFQSILSEGEATMKWDSLECEHVLQFENQGRSFTAAYPTKKVYFSLIISKLVFQRKIESVQKS
jgi:hypothetical protein